MRSFTIEVPNLQDVGPVVDLKIGTSAAAEKALTGAGQTVPQPIGLTAQIDTGSSGSVIQKGLPDQLGLKPIGTQHISTPTSTNVFCYEYRLRFHFPNRVVFETTAIEAPLEGQNIHCLLGRDLLSRGVFVYIGYRNLFSLSV